jgi:hypothetical protein
VARLVVAEHPDGDAVDVPPANDASSIVGINNGLVGL